MNYTSMLEVESIKKGDTFPVLDHGYIKVVDWMGEDADVVRAARMSTGRGFEGWEPGEVCKECRFRREEGVHAIGCALASSSDAWTKIPGDFFLLENLLSNRHTTPFEMVELKIEVMAPIMVYREWHRHRTQSYSEFSARYAQMPNLHYIPELERICKQSKSNKQGSGEAFPEEYAADCRSDLMNEQESIYQNYDRLVQDGVSREVARVNTPVSRYSKMTAKTDLWNWLAFLNLREDPPAQWEIHQYALVVSGIIKALFPKTHMLWEEYMRYAIRLSQTEHTVVRNFFEMLEPSAKVVLEATAIQHLGEKKAKAFMQKISTLKA